MRFRQVEELQLIYRTLRFDVFYVSLLSVVVIVVAFLAGNVAFAVQFGSIFISFSSVFFHVHVFTEHES